MDISCYANSILAAVLNMQCIKEYFLTYGQDGPIHREIRNIVSRQGSEAQSLDMLRELVTRTDNTGNWTARIQQDSCEFFQSFLRSLEIESSTCRVVGPTLDNFFKVTLQPVFQCSNGCPSENLASLPNVGFLPIPATNCNTVEQSLGQVLNTEDGVFKNCGHCPGNIGRVTTKIETFPEVLLLQLERFRRIGGVIEKIDRRITTPETLNFAQDGTSYSLTSAVVHSGTPSAGHYVTLIKCPQTGSLFTVDDHRAVKPYDARTDLLDKSYLLVYKRNADNGLQDRTAQCVSQDIEGAASTSGVKSGDNLDRRRSRFEELLSDLPMAKTKALIDRYGIKKQNAIKRMKDDLRRYFRKHVEEQNDILRHMTVPITAYNPGNHTDESGDSQMPYVLTAQSHPVSESGDFELPSPPYVPQTIAHTDPVGSIENLLATADGPTLSRILRHLLVEPQTSLARRRAQLKKLLPGRDLAAILRDLQITTEPNKECHDSERAHISRTHPVQSEEAMDIDLPSPAYVPMNPQRVSDLDDTGHSNTHGANPAPTELEVAMNEELPSPANVPLNQDSIYNIESWSRTHLQQYIRDNDIQCNMKGDDAQLKKLFTDMHSTN